MTNESDPAVTRVTVILDSPKDWFDWLFIRKDSCRRHDLWQFVDPEKDKEELPKLFEPVEPQISSYKSDATVLAQLERDDRESYRWDYDRYERRLSEYKRKVQALADFNLEISKTVSKKRLYLIQDCETPYQRLVMLKKHLAPDAATRRHEVTEKYNSLKVAPSSMTKISQWLTEWTRVVSMGKAIKLPETEGIKPQEDFLVACRAIDSEYATTCLRDVYRSENSGTTNLLPSLDDYVAEFTAFLRRNKPVSSSVNVAAADLEVANPKTQDHEAQKNRNGKSIPLCICGMRHWYAECFILNKNHPKRPSNYAPPHDVLKKVNEARKDPKIEERVVKALNQWTMRQQKSKPLRLDDGYPPTHFDTHVANILYTPDIKYGDKDQDLLDDSCVIYLDSPTDLSPEPVTMALNSQCSDILLNRWIVDPGSNTHVINSEAWKGWTRERDNTDNVTVNAGNSRLRITAWGRVELVAHGPKGLQTLLLTHVAYVEGFLTSVIGLARCRKECIHFDSGKDLLYKHHHKNIVAKLEYNGGHWLIDADPSNRPKPSDYEINLSSFGTSHRPSHAPKPKNIVDRNLAHQIWAHPSTKAIDYLEVHVDGIQLIGGKITDCLCQVCIETRLKRIISRRPSEDKATRPFYRLGIDILYIVPLSDRCWNGDRYLLHAVDEYSKWNEVATVRDKKKLTLINWIKGVIRKIQRVFDSDVCVIRSDNESGFGNELMNLCNQLGIILESTAVATPEQNGMAERTGAILTSRARAMHIQSNLPKSLANELYKTAAYLVNRTPTESLGWKTPYEVVWKRKPLVAHLRPIGCRAYALNQNIQKADKISSRALIGYLLGYQGTNLFRVWLPSIDDVIIMRDVVFDPSKFFNERDIYADKSIIEQTVETLDYPELIEDCSFDLKDLLTSRQRLNQNLNHLENESQVGGEALYKEQGNNDSNQSAEYNPQLPTPEASIIGDTEIEKPESTLIPEGYRAVGDPAPHEINLNPYDTSLIISGKRERKQAPDPNVFYIHAHATSMGSKPLNIYLNTFFTEASKPYWSTDLPRAHQSQLPLPPKNVKALESHRYGKQFRQALFKEWNSLNEKGCFKKTNKTKATADAEVLPLKWVFSYKTSEDGFLASFKARLVIRGDLEQPLENTYAATLAIRNFRALVSIANYFDLELKQYDVPTAFLNAKLNRKLYVEAPDGLQYLKGELLEVLRALYGLKESPLLWFEELKKTLIQLGLKPVPSFPCLYINSWLILFVYVDDIVMAYHNSNSQLHNKFEQQLVDVYDLKKMGDLAWFLGMRVLRNRESHKSWLILDAYIDKVCARFGIDAVGKCPEVPLTENWLPQSDEEPNTFRTKLYQQLVGSLAYIAVWGRPDVARAHVLFACHLTNPGQVHISKIKQTWRYLLGTRSYALEASSSKNEFIEYITDDPTYKDPLFFGSSDASYADEPETRRSSQGYLFKFGGMSIDWRSTVQRTVTKSTTEAELLSLSLTGSQMREWIRFFEEISLNLDTKPTIWCDNQQTVGIATKSQDKLHTKVKHVDIHQLWIRQEVEASRLSVVWVPTDKMPADGLTKMLPKQKFKEFLIQLGLKDIKNQLREAFENEIKDM